MYVFKNRQNSKRQNKNKTNRNITNTYIYVYVYTCKSNNNKQRSDPGAVTLAEILTTTNTHKRKVRFHCNAALVIYLVLIIFQLHATFSVEYHRLSQSAAHCYACACVLMCLPAYPTKQTVAWPHVWWRECEAWFIERTSSVKSKTWTQFYNNNNNNNCITPSLNSLVRAWSWLIGEFRIRLRIGILNRYLNVRACAQNVANFSF